MTSENLDALASGSYPIFTHYNPHGDGPMNSLQKSFEGETRFEYDDRINDYNWYALFAVQFIGYFIAQWVIRKTVPAPGKLEDFRKRNKEVDYHTYYFQYTSFIHAIVGCIFDPLIMYYGGYRYNQPSHLYHKLLICHAFAYFLYDTIIEIYYKCDDLLINGHHAVVLWCSISHTLNPFGGWEFCMIHLLAEISNPFLQIRTALRICGLKDAWYYKLNDKVFAAVFIIARLILSPIIMIFIYEGNNVLFITKFGMSLVVFIQYFWGLKILYNIGLMVKEVFVDPAESKEKKTAPPVWAVLFHDVFYAIEKNKKARLGVSLLTFTLFVLIPNFYYGFVRGTLIRNF